MDSRIRRIYLSEHNSQRRDWIATRTYTEPVLDVGCAEGYMTSAIPYRVTAVDLLDLDDFDAPNATFVQASIYDMPFSDASFATVCAFEILEHLHRPEEALAEIGRVCSERFYLTVPSFGKMRETKGHVQDFEDIGALVEAAGFSVITTEEIGPFTCLEARR